MVDKAEEILAKLDEGEPYFVFRGNDILSLFALQEYLDVVEKFDADSDHAHGIIDAMNDFRQWQRANPAKVKLPD